MKRLSIAIFFAAQQIIAAQMIAAQGLSPAQVPGRYVQEIHYLLSLPAGYDSTSSTRWPLLIFLHGSGESGTDLAKVKTHGPPKLIGQGKQLPFIIISPQATNGWRPDQLMGMINDIRRSYKVDADRVYLTGLSMGGYGTWALAAEYPEQFAAIAPICGGGDPGKAWKLRHMPVWCFHGAKDNVVPLNASAQMIDALKPINPNVRFTIYPEANHDSWTETYNNDSLFTWLLTQRKFRFTPARLSSEILQNRTGTFVSGIDTVDIGLNNDTLVLKPRMGRTVQLRPASSKSFYVREDMLTELVFDEKKKKPASFVLMTGRGQNTYTRIKTKAKK